MAVKCWARGLERVVMQGFEPSHGYAGSARLAAAPATPDGPGAAPYRPAVIRAPLAVLPTAFCVREISLRSVVPADWDAQMRAAWASMRSAHAHLRALALKYPLPSRVRVFSIAFGGAPDVPIGWFTIKRDGKVSEFYDGVLLLPDYAHLWGEALGAALAHLGPGVYRYGWPWSLEQSREAALREFPGARVIEATGIVVQGVDFSRWPDWASYYASLSQNSRRNAKKVAAVLGDGAVTVRRGTAILRDVPTLVSLRRAMYARKAMAFNAPRAALAGVMNALLCPSQAIIASIKVDGAVRSIMRLVEFGTKTYYLDGAAASGGDGAAWYLTLDVLQRAHRHCPTGKFLMGFYIVGTELSEGLIRARQSVRVTDWPTSVVTFEWQPAT